MSNKPTLDEVAKEFTDWRAKKNYSIEPIPDKLWSKAITLLDDYSLARVAVTLKVRTFDLKKRMSSTSYQKNYSNQPPPKVQEKPSIQKQKSQSEKQALNNTIVEEAAEVINVTRFDMPTASESPIISDQVIYIKKNGAELTIPISCPQPMAMSILTSFLGGV